MMKTHVILARLAWIVVVATLGACQEKHSDQELAAQGTETGNTDVLGLVPMRAQAVGAPGLSLAAAVTNANLSRLSYGLVSCSDQGARNALVAKTQSTYDAYVAQGNSLRETGGNPLADCSIDGNSLISAPVLLALMTATPKSEGDAVLQQAIWQAMRAPQIQFPSYRLAAVAFFHEGLGVIPDSAGHQDWLAIHALDMLYNPCEPSLPPTDLGSIGFDKRKFFQCALGGSFAFRSDDPGLVSAFDSYRGALLQRIDVLTQAQASDVNKADQASRDAMAGYYERVAVAKVQSADLMDKTGAPGAMQGFLMPAMPQSLAAAADLSGREFGMRRVSVSMPDVVPSIATSALVRSLTLPNSGIGGRGANLALANPVPGLSPASSSGAFKVTNSGTLAPSPNFPSYQAASNATASINGTSTPGTYYQSTTNPKFAQFGGDNGALWQSSNGGQTWTQVQGAGGNANSASTAFDAQGWAYQNAWNPNWGGAGPQNAATYTPANGPTASQWNVGGQQQQYFPNGLNGNSAPGWGVKNGDSFDRATINDPKTGAVTQQVMQYSTASGQFTASANKLPAPQSTPSTSTVQQPGSSEVSSGSRSLGEQAAGSLPDSSGSQAPTRPAGVPSDADWNPNFDAFVQSNGTQWNANGIQQTGPMGQDPDRPAGLPDNAEWNKNFGAFVTSDGSQWNSQGVQQTGPRGEAPGVEPPANPVAPTTPVATSDPDTLQGTNYKYDEDNNLIAPGSQADDHSAVENYDLPQ